MTDKAKAAAHRAHVLGSQPRTEDVLIDKEVDFPSLFLPEELLKGLEECGFKKPSPIQLRALPLARCGLDLIIQAKSGTGKTLTFSLVALELVDVSLKAVQVLVLTPTREIALQITDVISSVGFHMKGLKVSTFIGGLPLELDKEKLKNCHIAVGAPGRIRHLIELNMFYTKAVKLIVLDEADKLMEDSFIEDIDTIYAEGPGSCQVLTSSATYTTKLISFLSQYMVSPKHLTPEGSVNVVLQGVKQFVYLTPFSNDKLAQILSKQQHLIELLGVLPFDQCIVFSNSYSRAQSVCNLLVKEGHSAVWLAGKLDQQVRIRAMTDLKQHRARILVTTDLSARGIDASCVNLVVNLDVPTEHRTYLHRVGRAGRYGSYGMAITIVSSSYEETHFRKMIGKISESHSVEVIQPGFKTNLWNVKEGTLEQLYGIPPSDEDDSDVSGEEGDSKKVDKKKAKKKKKGCTKKDEGKFVVPKLEEVGALQFPSMAQLGDSLSGYNAVKPKAGLVDDDPENFLKWVPVNMPDNDAIGAEQGAQPQVLFLREVYKVPISGSSSEDEFNNSNLKVEPKDGGSTEIPPRYKKQEAEKASEEDESEESNAVKETYSSSIGEMSDRETQYFIGTVRMNVPEVYIRESICGYDYQDRIRVNLPIGRDSSSENYKNRFSLNFAVGRDSSPEDSRDPKSKAKPQRKKIAEEDEIFGNNYDKGNKFNLRELTKSQKKKAQKQELAGSSNARPKRKTQKKKKVVRSNPTGDGSDSEVESSHRNPYKNAMENWIGAWAAQCYTIQQYVRRSTRQTHKN